MNSKQLLLTTVLITSLSSAVMAEITIGSNPTYRDYKEYPGAAMDSFLNGAYDGISWYLVAQMSKKSSKDILICPPRNMVINLNNIKDIINRQAKHIGADADDKPLVFILINGLRRTFPCN
jgi:hypothetical protein